MVSSLPLIEFFLLGLTGSFAPCLFPVLPAFLAYLTESSTNPMKGFLSAILTILGVFTVFISLSLLLNFFTKDLNPFLASNYLRFRFYEGVLLILFGILIAFSNNLKIGFFDTLASKSNNFLQKIENPWLLSFLIGFFFAFLAAPCAFIVFGTFFVQVTFLGSFSDVIFANILFALGVGVPFLLLGFIAPLFKESIKVDSKKLSIYVPIVTGLIILGTGVFLIYDALQYGYSVF